MTNFDITIIKIYHEGEEGSALPRGGHLMGTMEENSKKNQQVLYKEELSKYIAFGESYRSIYQITRIIWLYRSGAVAILLLIYYLNNILNFQHWWSTFLLSILILYLIIVSIAEKKAYRSATPITIYTDGIQMYSSTLQRMLGSDGFVPKEDIRSITVIQINVILERQPHEKSTKYFRWRDVPAELIIKTKRGKKHSSGIKHPEKISRMISIIRAEWNMPVFDKYGERVSRIEFEPGREERP